MYPSTALAAGDAVAREQELPGSCPHGTLSLVWDKRQLNGQHQYNVAN